MFLVSEKAVKLKLLNNHSNISMVSSHESAHGLPSTWSHTLRHHPRSLVSHLRTNYPPLTEHEYTRLMRFIHIILRGRTPFRHTHTMWILDITLEQIHYKGLTVAQVRRLLRSIHQYYEEGSRNDLFWSIIIYKYVTDPWLFDRQDHHRSFESYFWVDAPAYIPSVPYQRYTLDNMEHIRRTVEQRLSALASPVSTIHLPAIQVRSPIVNAPAPQPVQQPLPSIFAIPMVDTDPIPVWAQEIISPKNEHETHRLLPIRYLEKENCTICLNEPNKNTLYVLPCLHTFHESCIQQWYQSQKTCPNCRVEMSQLIK